MNWTITNTNISIGNENNCVSNYSIEQCFYAQYMSEHIETPIFSLQSRFDEWQIDCILDIDNATDSSNYDQINSFGDYLVEIINNSAVTNIENNDDNNQFGVFLESCFHHVGKWGDVLAHTSYNYSLYDWVILLFSL